MTDAITELVDLMSDQARADAASRDTLYRSLYDELHRIARALLARHHHAPSSPTSLINEAWLRLRRSGTHAVDREHFLSLVARAMRFAIVDRIRQHTARNTHTGLLPPETEVMADALDIDRLVALDRALTRLESADPRAAKVVELNFFAGMPMSEIAMMLGVTERTIRRDWRRARAFLLAESLPPGSAAI